MSLVLLTLKEHRYYVISVIGHLIKQESDIDNEEVLLFMGRSNVT